MDGHLLDGLHHLPDLRFFLGQELHRQLPERGLTARLHQRLNEQRLIDVAHPHFVFDEVDKFGDSNRGIRFGHATRYPYPEKMHPVSRPSICA